jgi:hypothetical protein
VPTLSSHLPSEYPSGVDNEPTNGSFRIPIKRKTSCNVDDGDHEQFQLELESEINNVEEKGNRPGGTEQYVGAETAKDDEAQQ